MDFMGGPTSLYPRKKALCYTEAFKCRVSSEVSTISVVVCQCGSVDGSYTF